ncbi:homeobox protein engrailed-1-B-like [Venturia canescens]|uniref:homeobox protein engrailed-1-B-like n=1 Tax=Venturia canescens TaxID=32260 RepID=UPI001C9CC7EA|nr:homeobox protein engrailed-1-B-like [Venturia canescens]
MSQSHRVSRLSSDFSIARILATDGETKAREFFGVVHQHVPYVGDSKQNRLEDTETTEYSVPRSTVGSRLHEDNCPRSQFTSSDTSCSSNTNLSQSISPADHSAENVKFEKNELSWLQCTRYRPPKLPRKSSSAKTGKRRPGAHPRIPFTSLQIQILEEKYRSTAYLSRRDVVHLSTSLRLPQSRVKIWFQNRRARDRRETGIVGNNVTIVSEDGSLAHKSSNSSIDESSSTNPL